MTGRAPTYPRLAVEDVRGRKLWFLLDLTWGGQTIHLSMENVLAPTGDQAANVQYHSGLEMGDVEDILELLSDSPNAKDAGLTLYLEPHISVKDMLSDGHILGSMRGKLHIWPDGGSPFITIIDGRLRNPTWNVDGDPITGTLEEDPTQDEARIPAVSAKVDSTTWPNHDANVTDEFYPTVIGTPGRPEAQPLDPVGTPCLFVDTSAETLLASDGDVIGSGGGQTITVWNENEGTKVTKTIAVTVDSNGRVVSTIDISQASQVMTNSPGDKYWCIWGSDDHGIVGDDNTAALTKAGDVLVWMLRKSSLRWDEGRVHALKPVINRFLIDTYIQASPQQRIEPWAWIQSELLPILPISPRIGAGGLYFVLWDYFLDSTATVATLEQGRNAYRDGGIETTDLDDIASTVSIRYQWAATTNEFEGFAGLSGDQETLDANPSFSPNLFLRRARNLYGANRVLEGQTEVVWDALTAGLIVAWQARAFGSQYMLMDYLVDPEIGATVEPGRSVTVTDADRGFTDRLAIVESVTWTLDGLMRMGLRMPPVDLGEAG